MRTVLLVACVLALAVPTGAQSVPDAVEAAEEHREAGRPADAVAVMERAVADAPEDPEAHAYLGLYLGMSAGEADDMMKAAALTQRAFEHLDRAVALDPQNPHALHFRGLLGVNVPEFLGKLPGAVEDLERVIAMYDAFHDKVPFDTVVSSYLLLGAGREKQGSLAEARRAWEKVLELAPGTAAAEEAQRGVDRVSVVEDPRSAAAVEAAGESEVESMLDDAETMMNEGDHGGAAEVLRAAAALDPASARAFKLLVRALGGLASAGYDERIAEDTDLRTNLALEMMEAADNAVKYAPDDMEVRLLRGILSVELPFFVNALDRGAADLEMVIESDMPEPVRAEARYYLGRALRRRALSTWLDVLESHPNTRAAELVKSAMRPTFESVDIGSIPRPAVVVEYVLGFEDELPPQTAVWIETASGAYVTTLYVSGFSGHARESQVNLPVWAGTSEFAGIDAVTSASVGVGHHAVVWDLSDAAGGRVPGGEYVARVETAYWPSMERDLVGVSFTVGEQVTWSRADEGRLIPHCAVTSLP
jgi:tetratricopeptide (TPR) repeat protein